MVYIYAVRYKDGSSTISDLKWISSTPKEGVISKEKMIDFINQNPNQTKTMFHKNNKWEIGEDVRVVNNRYLRTDANNKDEDNLGNLPTF